MYRAPTPKPSKPEGERPSLDELAVRGGQRHLENDLAARTSAERALKEARDAEATEVRRREHAFAAGMAPLSRVLSIAGLIGLLGLPVLAFGAWTDADTSREHRTLGYVAAALVPVAGLMFLIGRAWRRRVIERAHVYIRSLPYPLGGFFEAFGVDWTPTSATTTHPFGRLIVAIQLSSALEGETRLTDALAAVARGTLTTFAPNRLQITSEPFVEGSEAHAWFCRVLDQFMPALHDAHGIARIDLCLDA